MTMTQLLMTFLLVVIPFGLMLGPLMHAWNTHTRGSAVGFTVLVVIATLVFQGCWEAAGGMV